VKRSRTLGQTTSWIVYVGGIYEKNSDDTYVKYYSAFGRRIAMRSGPEGSAGVVNYILSDHLGSSSVVTDGAGAVVGSAKYYPYGTPRAATGAMDTDKLFTGQQREVSPPWGTELGLYDYGARFYSALMGRFLSPDPLVAKPGDPQMLNRYAYVRNNPLIFVDPSGIYAMFVCGMGQSCETSDVDDFEEWVKEYWRDKYGWDEDYIDNLWLLLNETLANGATPTGTVWYFDVAFFDTEGVGGRSILAGGDVIASVEELNSLIAGLDALPGRDMDLMVGYSFGGVVAHDYVWGTVHGKISNTSGDFDLVLLQPALDVGFFPFGNMWEMARDERRWNDPRHAGAVPLPAAPHPELHTNEWEGGTIITINESPYTIGGEVWGAVNLKNPGGCAGSDLSHCTHQEWAQFVIPLLACYPQGCITVVP
jgi:RHS repeat-associated protein